MGSQLNNEGGSGMNWYESFATMALEAPYDTTNGYTTLNDTDSLKHPQESFRYLGIVIGLVDIVLGTIGNSMTIIAYIKNRKLRRNVFNLFIVNLSVIDLLTASCMMPFNIAGYLNMRWPFGNNNVTCALHAFFYFCCGYTSVVCLLAITMNRFVGIVLPDRYVRLYSSRWLYVILLFSWTVAPAFLLPALIKSVINNANGIYHTPTGWNEEQFLCTFVRIEEYWMPYMQTVRIVFQFLPVVLIIAAYVTIWYKVHESNIRLQENTGSKQCKGRIESARRADNTQVNYSPAFTKKTSPTEEERRMLRKPSTERSELQRVEYAFVSGSPKKPSNLKNILNLCKNEEENHAATSLRNNNSVRYDRSESTGENTRKHKEQRLIYVSVIIWLTFTILFLPSLLINLIPVKFGPKIHMAASNITWLNSCVNPLIYVALHRRMRKEYKKIVKRCFNSFFSLDRR